MASHNMHSALGIPLLTLAVETPPGFIRELIESRFVAIVLGATALVAMLLWLGWQMRAVREHAEATRGEARDD